MSLVLPQFGDDERCEQDIDEVGTDNENILDLITRAKKFGTLYSKIVLLVSPIINTASPGLAPSDHARSVGSVS